VSDELLAASYNAAVGAPLEVRTERSEATELNAIRHSF